MRRRATIGWLAVLAAPGGAAGGFGDDVRPLVEAHCVACHEGPRARGGLRLDGPAPDLRDPAAADAWAAVLDRLDAREMPPPDADQPSAAGRAAAVAVIERELAAAALARRADRGGRGTARRLNRVEYENTVRDLLRLDLDLKSLLPEDGGPGRFDTLAADLATSGVHLDGYLQAARAAADAAFPDRPPPPAATRTITARPAKVRQPPGTDYRLQNGLRELSDGTLVFFNSLHQHLITDQFQAVPEGRYRVRVRASAYQSDRPLVLALYAGSFHPRNYTARLVGHFEVPPGEPRTIEFTERLAHGGTVKPVPHGLGHRELAFDAPYDGPGVAVHGLEFEGPLADGWPTPAHRDLFGDRPWDRLTAADARPALARFLTRAFRRPATPTEIDGYAGTVGDLVAGGEPLPAAFRAVAAAALCSPEFLFLRARGPVLDGYELAARLAYFLWSSCPDDALAAAAGRGDLATPAGLAAQAGRLLADPRAARFTENFCGQWLGLRQIDATRPDSKLYPEFDDLLLASMARETHLTFEEVLGRDLGVGQFADADWAFVDGRLARHYGLPGVEGLEFRKVRLPPGSPRGGLLTQASVLKVTANGTTTSPVVRGNWVLRNLLGRPTKGPPPDVPAVEPDVRGATSIRDQLAAHRSAAACAGCHDRIDPPGLALEAFDVTGAERTYYRAAAGRGPPVRYAVDGRHVGHRRGPAVDASGVLPTGERFAGPAEFKRLLARDPRAVAGCVVGKLIAYGTGAEPDAADRPAVRAVLDRAAAGGYGLRTLLMGVIRSDVFRAR